MRISEIIAGLQVEMEKRGDLRACAFDAYSGETYEINSILFVKGCSELPVDNLEFNDHILLGEYT